MLMVTDSASLASVDAISGHNVDARSSTSVHNLGGDMNAGGHTKLIRLDRNQKRENRFWRKQRVKERKQRKWEEQLRRQQDEEQQDAEQAASDDAAIENNSADEQDNEDSADDIDSENAPDDTASHEQDDGNFHNEAIGDHLADSGYNAEKDEGQQDAAFSGDDDGMPLSDDERPISGGTVVREHDGNHALHEDIESEEVAGNAEARDQRDMNYSAMEEQDERGPSRDGASNEQHAHEDEDDGPKEDEYEDREEVEDDVDGSKDSLDEGESRSNTEQDNSFSRSAAGEDVNLELSPKSTGNVDKFDYEADSTEHAGQQSNHDGYETDDEREKTRGERDDEEQDSAVGGSSEDQAGHDEDGPADTNWASGGGSPVTGGPASDWVGPRSVSPYIEQQLPAAGDAAPPEQEDGHDSAVERDSVFSADEEAAPAGRSSPSDEQGRPDSAAQKRPPSRVSLVYTYASGPKVLSHVELAPESEGERRQSATEPRAETQASVDSTDDKNSKRVTFEEDVKAASSIRIRRRRTESVDEGDSDTKQWKEIRKKNKERRKNRTSNTFSDVLRPVSSRKSSSTTGSLMNDKRLIKTGNIGTLVLHGQPQPRWNAYFANARALSNSGGPSLTDIIRYQEARRRDAGLGSGSISRRGVANGRRRDDRIRTPPAVAGRKHYRGQTEPYLEEIRDRRLETDQAVQTDPMLDRPSTPLFVPAKTGADAFTQIYEGDLFDFELESAPILEVLVGKTVEQSLLEVMEEEELETLREHQRRFEERRQAELAEQQRLAERERRHVEEKERRMSQRRTALEQEQETEAKVAASALAQNYLADMVPAVFSNLRQKGFFFNGIERDIETSFMPWLRDAVEQELDKVLTGREVLDDLILSAVRKRREELERRPPLSSRLPPSPLADTAAEPEVSDAAEEDEDEDDEEVLADDEEDEDAAEEGTDEDEALAKASDEAAPEPDEDGP